MCTCAKVGVIYVNGEWYFIEPLQQQQQQQSAPDHAGFSDGANLDHLVEHVIYPRNATTPSPARRTCDVRG